MKARRHAKDWINNPEQHWPKIADPSNDNAVIAAGAWSIYEEALANPQKPFDAT